MVSGVTVSKLDGQTVSKHSRAGCMTGSMHGGEPATQKAPISHDGAKRQFKRTLKARGRRLGAGRGARTILFTVETQEELCRGFYPSIGGALG